MPAYVVAYVAVKDPESMGRYVDAVTDVTLSHGGRYLFAGPGAEVLEGDWPGDGLAIIEFPTREAAQRWYESAEYTEVKPLRQAAGPTALVLTPEVPA